MFLIILSRQMTNGLKFPEGALYMVIIQILVSEGSNSIAHTSISGSLQNSLMLENCRSLHTNIHAPPFLMNCLKYLAPRL
jgi:hypothetical protein